MTDTVTANPNWKVLRPHGAVNWVRRVAVHIAGDNEQGVIDLAEVDQELPLEEFTVVTHFKTVERAGYPLFPALTLPVQTKELDLPAAQREHLERVLAKATRVLVVGWRATELHFLRLWQERQEAPLLLLVVGRDHEGAAATLEAVSKYVDVADGLASVSEGFSAFVRAKELDDFLDLG